MYADHRGRFRTGGIAAGTGGSHPLRPLDPQPGRPGEDRGRVRRPRRRNCLGTHDGSPQHPISPVRAQGELLTMPSTVAELCESQKISLAELVTRSGLEEGRLSAILLGRWTPAPAERQKVAAASGVSVDEISWGHKTPIQHLWGHGPGGRMNGS